MWLIYFFALVFQPPLPALDFDAFKATVQPLLTEKRPGHARCITCHSTGTAFRLIRLPQGATAYTEEESRKNFEAASRMVLARRAAQEPAADRCRWRTRRAAPSSIPAASTGSRRTTPNGRRWPPGSRGTSNEVTRDPFAITCASATSSATRRRSSSTPATPNTSTSRSTSSCAPSASCRISSTGRLDFQLVKQTVEWKAPARFDQVLELSIAAIRLGTTSFTLGTTFRIAGEERVIVARRNGLCARRTHGR